MKYAPIALFAYKRPEHIRRLLESLATNREAGGSELHVFIDGPKNAHDTPLIQKVKRVAESKQWCGKVLVYCNQHNKGAPSQVINTVTEFCEEKERIIVLEDDLVLSPYFLSFMNHALDIYADQEKVMEVTGYLYPVNRSFTQSGFMRGSCGWGWGTWQRAWKFFERDGAKLLIQIKEGNARYEFDYRGSHGFYKLLKSQVQGKIGGWDIRWAASIFLNDGLTFFPGKSLVQNIGLDGSGTNIPNTQSYRTTLSSAPISHFPNHIEESEELLSATIDFFRSQKNLKILWEKLTIRLKMKMSRLRTFFLTKQSQTYSFVLRFAKGILDLKRIYIDKSYVVSHKKVAVEPHDLSSLIQNEEHEETKIGIYSSYMKKWDEEPKINDIVFNENIVWVEKIVLPLLKQASILDVGCGTGVYGKFLTEKSSRARDWKYCGIEMTRCLADLCQSFVPHGDFKVGDARKIPCEDKSFDLVLASGVLLLLGQDWIEALKECARVARRYMVILRHPLVKDGPSFLCQTTVRNQKSNFSNVITVLNQNQFEECLTKTSMTILHKNCSNDSFWVDGHPTRISMYRYLLQV